MRRRRRAPDRRRRARRRTGRAGTRRGASRTVRFVSFRLANRRAISYRARRKDQRDICPRLVRSARSPTLLRRFPLIAPLLLALSLAASGPAAGAGAAFRRAGVIRAGAGAADAAGAIRRRLLAARRPAGRGRRQHLDDQGDRAAAEGHRRGAAALAGARSLDDFFRDFFGDKGGDPSTGPRAASLGSGFIIDPSGLIVTNNHVIANAEQITVTLSDDTSLQAQVIGRDSVTDLALLKVEPKAPLPAASWGDSSEGAGRRLGARDRQPVRAWRLGHRRHHLGDARATSIPAPMTTICRPTRRSTAAIPAGRCSICRAR